MKVGFIGLGVMGFPMAGHLHSSEHDLRVFNRSEEKSIKWIESYGGKSLKDLKDVAEFSDVIILCIGKDDDVRNVLGGEKGLINNLKAGTVIVDHTTTSSELPIEMNNLLNPLDIQFIDAPISGGQAGAELGQLSIMAGGDKQAFSKIDEVINNYAKFTKYMGKSGSGQLTKMVNQICIAGLLQGLAEGINFSEKVGLNSSDVLEVILTLLVKGLEEARLGLGNAKDGAGRGILGCEDAAISLKNAVKYRIQKLKHHWFTKTTHIVHRKSLGTLKTDIATQEYNQIACCELYATTYKADVYLNYVDGSVFSHSFFNQFFARPEIRFSLNPKESQLTLGIGSTIESLERRYFFTSLVLSSPYISFNLNYKIDALV